MQSWNMTLRPHNINYATGEYLRFVGQGDLEMARTAIKENNLPEDPAKLVKTKIEFYRELVKDVHLREGVLELIEELFAHKLKLGIASSEITDVVNDILIHKRIDRYFSAVIGSDKVKKKKPDPEIYRKALDALGVKAEEAVAIEDSESGARAAQSAKIDVIAVPNSFTKSSDFSYAKFVAHDFKAIRSRLIT